MEDCGLGCAVVFAGSFAILGGYDFQLYRKAPRIWSINIGLVLMVLLSLLPVGIAQAIASIDKGMWYARSAEFMLQDYLQVLRGMRAIGDTIFAAGIVAVAWFVLGLVTGRSVRPLPPSAPSPRRRIPDEPEQVRAELVN